MTSQNSNDINEEPKKKSGKKWHFSKQWIRDLMNGDVLVRDVVQRQMKFIILLLMLAMFYINNRFAYEAELKRLDELNQELVDARFRSLTIQKEMVEKGRRSQVEQRLQKLGSSLAEPNSPVIIVDN